MVALRSRKNGDGIRSLAIVVPVSIPSLSGVHQGIEGLAMLLRERILFTEAAELVDSFQPTAAWKHTGL